MPTEKLNGVAVFKDSKELREYHIKRNPNAVIFNPNPQNNKNQDKALAASMNRVHFEKNVANGNFQEDHHHRRPHSAHIISCSGYPQGEVAVPERPQSAVTYKEKVQRLSSAKKRSQFRVIEEPGLSTVELAEEIAEVVRAIKPGVGRVWRPKKIGDGIRKLLPRPMPIREATDLPEEPEEPHVPKLNGLAQFHRYKYPMAFHHYGKKENKNPACPYIHKNYKRGQKGGPTKCPFNPNCHIVRYYHEMCHAPQHSMEVPKCLKHPHNYQYSATQQSCRYKPFASVTTVSHGHKVESAALPHPLREVETPSATTTREDLHLVFKAVDAEENAVEDDALMKLEYTETNPDVHTDRDPANSTRVSSARTPDHENNGDLTKSTPRDDRSRSHSRENSNNAGDVTNTSLTLIDNQEQQESQSVIEDGKRPRSGRSGVSARSVQSVKSVQSARSVQSAYSVKSVQSAQGAHSVQSARSVQTADSVQSAQPVHSARSVQSVQSGRSAQSVPLGGSARGSGVKARRNMDMSPGLSDTE